MRWRFAVFAFQFTTSQGGRHFSRSCSNLLSAFQFTTSQGGRLQPSHNRRLGQSFNSRPHKEVDDNPGFINSFTIAFQFTTSQGGRRAVLPTRVLGDHFQFTTSQGGRQAGCIHPLLPACLSIHDLTRRSTVLRRNGKRMARSFNSRPHKEVDAKDGRRRKSGVLSIHDLTRRSTLITK